LAEVERAFPSSAMLSRSVSRIVIVTGHGSKALADFTAALGRTDKVGVAATVIRADVSSSQSLVSAVLSAPTHNPELIVLTRGGGPPVNLQPCSAPDLVRVIAQVTASIPVLVAVGHTHDATLAEAVASYSAPTPTAAGHLVRRLVSSQGTPIVPSTATGGGGVSYQCVSEPAPSSRRATSGSWCAVAIAGLAGPRCRFRSLREAPVAAAATRAATTIMTAAGATAGIGGAEGGRSARVPTSQRADGWAARHHGCRCLGG
jgi:hypothetical protein